jgi:hypothetical protein
MVHFSPIESLESRTIVFHRTPVGSYPGKGAAVSPLQMSAKRMISEADSNNEIANSIFLIMLQYLMRNNLNII